MKDYTGLSNVIRWIARIWSIPAILLVPMALMVPALDPIIWAEYGLSATCSLGLLLAWRWELVGGIITLVVMAGRITYFGALYVFDSVAWGVPAFLFLVYWYLRHRADE